MQAWVSTKMRTCRVTIACRVTVTLVVGIWIFWITSGIRNHTSVKLGKKLMKMGFEIGPNGEPTKHQDSIRAVMVENGQIKRRKLLKAHCRQYSKIPLSTYTKKHIYAVDEHQLLYCFIPKVGCSNWKRIMMVLHGQGDNLDSLTSEEVHKHTNVPLFNKFSFEEQSSRFANYTKFFFVRHPFKRVLSVYKNKFENPSYYRGNPLFHPYGKQIIKQWRKNPSEHALKTGEGVTWPEFVNYLIHTRDRQRFEKDDYANDHWREMYKICSPCTINYDFIGKLEDVADESEYLLKRLKINDKVKYLSSSNSRPTNSSDSYTYNNYFSMLNKEQITRLWNMYKTDFILFGYEKPEFVP